MDNREGLLRYIREGDRTQRNGLHSNRAFVPQKLSYKLKKSEVSRVAKRFRFALNLVAQLQPMFALVRMGTVGQHCRVKPFYERVAIV